MNKFQARISTLSSAPPLARASYLRTVRLWCSGPKHSLGAGTIRQTILSASLVSVRTILQVNAGLVLMSSDPASKSGTPSVDRLRPRLFKLGAEFFCLKSYSATCSWQSTLGQHVAFSMTVLWVAAQLLARNSSCWQLSISKSVSKASIREIPGNLLATLS